MIKLKKEKERFSAKRNVSFSSSILELIRIRSIFNGNKNFLKKMSFLRKQESPVYKGDS